jgi:hypothetical protein
LIAFAKWTEMGEAPMNFREGTRRLALLFGAAGAIAGGLASYVELQPVLSQRAMHNRFERLANSDTVKRTRRDFAPEAVVGGDTTSEGQYKYVQLPDGSYAKFLSSATNEEIRARVVQLFPNAYNSVAPYQQNADTGKNAAPATPPGHTLDPSQPKKPHITEYDPNELTQKQSQQGKYNQTDIADPWKQSAADFYPDGPWRIGEPSPVNAGGVKNVYWAQGGEVSSIETEDGQTLYPTPAPSAWMYLLIAILPLLGFLIPWGIIRAIGWVGTGFSEPNQPAS